MTTTTYTAQQVLNAATQGLDLGAAAILDSSANILSDLDSLEPLATAGKIGSISFTDQIAPALSLEDNQVAADLRVLSLFQGNYSLAVSFATVAEAEQFAAALPHATIGVEDVPDALLANLDTLQSLAVAGRVTSIEILPGSNPMTLTQAQLAADATAVGLISTFFGARDADSGVYVSVSGTFSVAQAVAAETLNTYIQGLTVVDSLANFEVALKSLPVRPEAEVLYDGLQPSYYKFASVTLTDSGNLTITVPYTDSTGMMNEDGFLTAITNRHTVDWTNVPMAEVPTLLNPTQPSTVTGIQVDIRDVASAVAPAIDYLESYDLAGQIRSITITDASLPVFTAAQLTADASVIAKITVAGMNAETAAADANQLAALHGVAVQDSAANVSAQLDALQSVATEGKLAGISLTDSGAPSITLSATQLTSDAAALADIQGTSQLEVTPVAGVTIKGMSGVATIADFAGTEASYSFAAAGDGMDLTVSGSGGSTEVSGVQALHFTDGSLIVAATPGPASAVTTGNLAELYGAVFGREPDVGGLAFYQAYMSKNPATSLQQYAEFFLNSPEYTANSEHAYAQTVAGDQQFITDSYQNLLHRAPSADEVAFYETNVIAPALKNLQAGTAAYAAADLAAHALTLVYFSASPEFLADVQVTATNPASAQHWLVLV